MKFEDLPIGTVMQKVQVAFPELNDNELKIRYQISHCKTNIVSFGCDPEKAIEAFKTIIEKKKLYHFLNE